MASITLNYNSRNMQAAKTLEYILSMGFFKPVAVKPVRVNRVFENDKIETHFASEAVLAKDWLNEKEDKVWATL